jgi:hypothetical protein
VETWPVQVFLYLIRASPLEFPSFSSILESSIDTIVPQRTPRVLSDRTVTLYDQFNAGFKSWVEATHDPNLV